MKAPAAARGLAARVCLLLGGACLIVSGFLPLDHPRTHNKELVQNLELFLECAKAYYWRDGVLFLGFAILAAAPILLGAVIAAAALLPRTRTVMAFLFSLHFAALAAIAATLCTWFGLQVADGELESTWAKAYAAGAVVFTALAGVECVVFYRSARSLRGSDAVHVLPLVVALLVGGVVAYVMRNNTQWHALDYVVLAGGALLGLLGVGLRRWG